MISEERALASSKQKVHERYKGLKKFKKLVYFQYQSHRRVVTKQHKICASKLTKVYIYCIKKDIPVRHTRKGWGCPGCCQTCASADFLWNVRQPTIIIIISEFSLCVTVYVVAWLVCLG